MITLWILRILVGDLIWFVLGGVAALMGWIFGGLFKTKWIRIIAGIGLAFLLVVVMHSLYESWYTWYTTPLDEPMHLIIR